MTLADSGFRTLISGTSIHRSGDAYRALLLVPVDKVGPRLQPIVMCLNSSFEDVFRSLFLLLPRYPDRWGVQ